MIVSAAAAAACARALPRPRDPGVPRASGSASGASGWSFLVVTVVNLWAMVFAGIEEPGHPRGQPRRGAVHDRLRDTVLRGRDLRAHHHRAELAGHGRAARGRGDPRTCSSSTC
ncbi:MAG: hypothetical protein MZU95_04725 [Desulfomicrobium escambiense]|nr:hypothetical protein [Desulfomicrobium escambiense]